MGNLKKSGQTLFRKEVQLIVKAINHSKEQYRDMANERKLGLSNGKYLDRWNYIFANIRDYFNYDPFITFHVNRGPLWEFIFIYNTSNKILYLILKEDTFKNIRDDKKNPNHYVRVFNSKNSNYEINNIEQLSMLPKNEVIVDKYVEEDLKSMLLDIEDDVKICKNILFTENLTGVNKISENIADYNLEILDNYDLTKYITADIENIGDTKDDVIESQQKIKLNIRKDKIKDDKDKIVSDKTKKTDKDKKNKENQ